MGYGGSSSRPFSSRFGDAMGQMMGDQMNPELWRNRLLPVTDILFETDGVMYIRKAPPIRDSHSDIANLKPKELGLKNRKHTKGAL